ncbi:MAG: hypothetical protein ACHQRM_13165 [Bacteroidia bacterium]
MKRLFFLLFLLPGLYSSGQINIKDSCVHIPMLQFSYAGQFPGGDMAHRFGYNSNICLNYSFKTSKNWVFGVDFAYIFGNQVRESVLDSISTRNHFVIDVNGELAEIHLWERGFSTTAWAGKLFPVYGPNPNCGLQTSIGLGFLQHHIKIEDIGNRSPQLAGDLKKGYDRLTNGPSVSEYIGYTYLSNNRFVNFFFGIEFTQAFTQDRRSWDYEMMKVDDKQRVDLLYGLRAGWILPLYKKNVAIHYYY